MINDRKEYMKAYYEAHRESEKVKHKAWRQSHKEQIKEQRKAYYQANKEQIKEQRKAYYDSHKVSVKSKKKEYYAANRESVKSKKKEYYAANKQECKDKVKAYKQAHKQEIKAYFQFDLNALGQTKNSIRCKSQYILKKSGIKIPGYQIHHCFTYDDPTKFIYCSKETHLKIHQFLRDNNIDADTDHYNKIKHLLDEKVVKFGI